MTNIVHDVAPWWKEVHQHFNKVSTIDQLASICSYEHLDGRGRGSRIAKIDTGGGLMVDVLIDRGFSLGKASCWGIPLAYLSPGTPAHPSFCNNKSLEWLKTFPGGLLSTCGFENVGSPCQDDSEELSLHGRALSIPAENVHTHRSWASSGEYYMSISGNILDNSLYGSKYVLHRSYTFCGGRPILRIDDQIFNEGFHAQPLMILQHMNFGFPLIDQGTQLIFPKNTVCHPRDNVAQLSLERAHHFEAPNENYQEQVFYHDFSTCSDDVVEVIIVNHQLQHWAGTGLSCHLRFDRRQYPYLVQWKLAKEGEYVLGLEPANCHVEGRHAEKLKKSLEHLKARETKNFSLEIELRLGRSRISEEPILFSLPHHQDHT